MRCSPPARCITGWYKTGLRCRCNILVETGTARDAHHFACLIGYGATAVYPYLAYQTLFDLMRKGALNDAELPRAGTRPQLPARHSQGLFKIMSKMGICTIASYRSAQLFEIVGLGSDCGGAVLRRLGEPHRGSGFRGPQSRRRLSARAGVGLEREREPGRLAEVYARRGVPHVQPGCDRDLAVGRHGGRSRAVPTVCGAGQRPARVVLARLARAQARPRHSRRGSRAVSASSSASTAPGCPWVRSRRRRTKRSPSP